MARIIGAVASSHTPTIGFVKSESTRFADVIKKANVSLD